MSRLAFVDAIIGNQLHCKINKNQSFVLSVIDRHADLLQELLQSTPSVEGMQQLCQKLQPGPWSINGILDPIFFNKFNHQSVRTNDIIVAYTHIGNNISHIDTVYMLYLGGGKYMFYDSSCEGYRICVYSDIRGKFHEHIFAKIHVPTTIDYTSDSRDKFHNRYISTLHSDRLYNTILSSQNQDNEDNHSNNMILQLYNWKGNKKYPYVAPQAINDMYMYDLFNIYLYYQDHENREEKMKDINQRKVIHTNLSQYDTSIQHLAIDLNRNAYGIFRDTNFSLSIVDTSSLDRPELVLFGFVITRDGSLDITQIGSNTKYYGQFDYEHMKYILAQTTIEFAKSMGLKKVRVIRGDKIGGYILPQQYQLSEGFTLEKHQAQMRLIYNVTPVRKRKRKKPGTPDDERYSAQYDL